MEALLIYLANSSAGIALFYSVYWLFLRKETFHSANRWFLLLALSTAVLLPIIPIHYSVITEGDGSRQGFRMVSDTFKHLPVVGESELKNQGINWRQAILPVYFAGASIILLRLLVQSIILFHLMLKHRIQLLDGVRIVENERYGLPFSFFNIVFIHPKFHTQDDLPEILAHEKVHIREHHWFDLLFIELLTVIFWFNPFIWFFERSIKQNHEYLADKGVLAQGHTVGRYQALLVNQLMGMQVIGITNNLNFALNANRLKMMTKKKTSRILGVKFMWALPALALLLFAFAEPEYRVTQGMQSDNETIVNDLNSAQKTIKVSGTVVNENGDPLPGASIVIKGSTIGTVSDIDGTFTLVDPNPKESDSKVCYSELVVSFVGLETRILTVSSVDNKLEFEIPPVKMKDAVQILYNSNYSGEQLIPPPPPPPPADKIKDVKAIDQKTPPPPPPSKTKSTEVVFYVVEDMPQYPGGFEAMQDYVSKMQQKLAQGKNLKGKATVSFTVNGKGKVTDIKVVEKDNDDAAKGAVMIVSTMEDWTPGKQRGKSVPVKYLLPIEFK